MAGLTTLAAAIQGGTFLTKLNKRKQVASIYELKDEDSSPTGVYRAFQYWPETITDTKAVTWATKEIPGGSLPLYQWTSSGERLISFTAVFTCDNDLIDQENVNANIFERLKDKGELNRNIDIRSALVWLRRFMLPKYSNDAGALGVPNVYAPPKFILSMPGTSIGLTGGAFPNDASTADSLYAIMLQCDITYVAAFPSGLPRVVEVALSFAQIAQLAGSVVMFPRRHALMDQAMDGDQKNFYGYALKGEKQV
jgi:hypothetical protein